MKKIHLTVILMACVFTGFSQAEKGSWLLGGNIQFSSNSQSSGGESNTASLFALNPKIGFFPVNNLAVILNTNYQSASSGSFSDHLLLIGPAVRYYVPASESVKFFFGGGVGFGSGEGSTSTAYQFEAGPSFFLSRMVAVELNIGYQTENFHTSNQFESDSKTSTFGIGLGFMIYLGGGKK
jgi:opacity protein-like surface antigen